MLGLSVDGGHVFHGSPTLFDVLEPHQTSRGGIGGIVYNAVSAHATPLLCCALNYLGRSNNKLYTNGVSLRAVPVRSIYVYGPKNRKDAMDHLFGRGGYLYVFKKNRVYAHCERARHVRGGIVDSRSSFVQDPPLVRRRSRTRAILWHLL